MTIATLRSELAAIRCHDLTETNVENIESVAGFITLDGYDRDADQMDDMRQDIATLEADLKQAEQERDELETQLARVADEPMNTADRIEEIERFKATARQYMERCEALQSEVSALRKRKGVIAGVCAYPHEVFRLLAFVSQTEGRYKDEANELLCKIQAL